MPQSRQQCLAVVQPHLTAALFCHKHWRGGSPWGTLRLFAHGTQQRHTCQLSDGSYGLGIWRGLEQPAGHGAMFRGLFYSIGMDGHWTAGKFQCGGTPVAT